MTTIIFLSLVLELCLNAFGFYVYFTTQRNIWAISFITTTIIGISLGIFASYTKALSSWIISLSALVLVSLLWTGFIISYIHDIDQLQESEDIYFISCMVVVWILIVASAYNLLHFIIGNHYRNFSVLHAPHLVLMSQIFIFMPIIFLTMCCKEPLQTDWYINPCKIEFWFLGSLFLLLLVDGIGVSLGIISLSMCCAKNFIYKMFGITSIIVAELVMVLFGVLVYAMEYESFGEEAPHIANILLVLVGLGFLLICISCHQLQRYMNRECNDNNVTVNHGLSCAFLLWPFTIFYVNCLSSICGNKQSKVSIGNKIMLDVSICAGILCYFIIAVFCVQ